MLESRLISLFRSFSKSDLKRLEAFLLSPYFNQSDKMIQFFRLIAPHQPLFDSKKLAKEKLYKALYGAGAYSDMTMRKLISDLFKLTRTFIAHEELHINDLDASVMRYRWLLKRGLEKLKDAELEVRRSLLDDYVQHDDNYYHQRWLYDLHKFEEGAERMRGAEHKGLTDAGVRIPIDALNRNYLINCFWLYLYVLTLSRIYNFAHDDKALNQLESMALPYMNKGDAVIDMFYCILQLIRTDEESWFIELKNLFLRKDKTVPVTVMREACIAMENSCIRKIRNGEERFSHELMQVYRFEVENELYFENGKMDSMYYHNIAKRAAETAETEWAEHFVENYKKYLPAESREDSYSYAKAHLLFAQKKYREALRLALSCNIPFFIGKLSLRNLVARAHYELGMLDELQIDFDSYRHYLKDEKIPDDRRQFFQVFITMMKLLAELRSNWSREKWLHLSDQIEGKKGIPNRPWFQEKVKELGPEKVN